MKKFKSFIIETASGPFVLCKKTSVGDKITKMEVYGDFPSMEEASEWGTDNIDHQAESRNRGVNISADSLMNCETQAKEAGITLMRTWTPRKTQGTMPPQESFNPFFYNTSKSQKYWRENELTEAVRRSRGENSASMVERATSVCMESWYVLTKTFNSSPDKYDPHPVEPSNDYMHFKLAPGIDARDSAFEKITDEAENIADKLNDALGRRLFEPEILRKDGQLEVRTVYVEGSGGIFKAKTREGEVGVIIEMTMPKQSKLREAFQNLITTPTMPMVDDGDGMGNDVNPQARQQPPMEGDKQSKESPMSTTESFFESFYIDAKRGRRILSEGQYDGLIGKEYEVFTRGRQAPLGTGQLVYVIGEFVLGGEGVESERERQQAILNDPNAEPFLKREAQRRLRELDGQDPSAARRESLRQIIDDPNTEPYEKRQAQRELDNLSAREASRDNAQALEGYFKVNNRYYRGVLNLDTETVINARTVPAAEVEELLAGEQGEVDLERARNAAQNVADTSRDIEEQLRKEKNKIDLAKKKIIGQRTNLIRQRDLEMEEMRNLRQKERNKGLNKKEKDRLRILKRNIASKNKTIYVLNNLVSNLYKLANEIFSTVATTATAALGLAIRIARQISRIMIGIASVLAKWTVDTGKAIIEFFKTATSLIVKATDIALQGIAKGGGAIAQIIAQAFRAIGKILQKLAKEVTAAVDKIDDGSDIETDDMKLSGANDDGDYVRENYGFSRAKMISESINELTEDMKFYLRSKQYLYEDSDDKDDILNESFHSEWKKAGDDRKRGKYPLHRSKMEEDVAANSIAAGGVDMAPDAGGLSFTNGPFSKRHSNR